MFDKFVSEKKNPYSIRNGKIFYRGKNITLIERNESDMFIYSIFKNNMIHDAIKLEEISFKIKKNIKSVKTKDLNFFCFHFKSHASILKYIE